jgi:hypothetical protein
MTWKERLFIYLVYFRLFLVNYPISFSIFYNYFIYLILTNTGLPINLFFSVFLVTTRFTLFLTDRNWSELIKTLATNFEQLRKPDIIIKPTYEAAYIIALWEVRTLGIDLFESYSESRKWSNFSLENREDLFTSTFGERLYETFKDDIAYVMNSSDKTQFREVFYIKERNYLSELPISIITIAIIIITQT